MMILAKKKESDNNTQNRLSLEELRNKRLAFYEKLYNKKK